MAEGRGSPNPALFSGKLLSEKRESAILQMDWGLSRPIGRKRPAIVEKRKHKGE